MCRLRATCVDDLHACVARVVKGRLLRLDFWGRSCCSQGVVLGCQELTVHEDLSTDLGVLVYRSSVDQARSSLELDFLTLVLSRLAVEDQDVGVVLRSGLDVSGFLLVERCVRRVLLVALVVVLDTSERTHFNAVDRHWSVCFASRDEVAEVDRRDANRVARLDCVRDSDVHRVVHLDRFVSGLLDLVDCRRTDGSCERTHLVCINDSQGWYRVDSRHDDWRPCHGQRQDGGAAE